MKTNKLKSLAVSITAVAILLASISALCGTVYSFRKAEKAKLERLHR